MSAIEKMIEQGIMVAHTKLGGRLFRNNTGTGWAGKMIRIDHETILIKNPHPLKAGLIIGGADTIGWTPIKITPEMVGTTVPIFTGFEAKSEKGRPNPDQKIFIANVSDANGIIGVVRSVQDYEMEIANWKRKNCCS